MLRRLTLLATIVLIPTLAPLHRFDLSNGNPLPRDRRGGLQHVVTLQ